MARSNSGLKRRRMHTRHKEKCKKLARNLADRDRKSKKAVGNQ